MGKNMKPFKAPVECLVSGPDFFIEFGWLPDFVLRVTASGPVASVTYDKLVLIQHFS